MQSLNTCRPCSHTAAERGLPRSGLQQPHPLFAPSQPLPCSSTPSGRARKPLPVPPRSAQSQRPLGCHPGKAFPPTSGRDESPGPSARGGKSQPGTPGRQGAGRTSPAGRQPSPAGGQPPDRRSHRERRGRPPPRALQPSSACRRRPPPATRAPRRRAHRPAEPRARAPAPPPAASGEAGRSGRAPGAWPGGASPRAGLRPRLLPRLLQQRKITDSGNGTWASACANGSRDLRKAVLKACNVFR